MHRLRLRWLTAAALVFLVAAATADARSRNRKPPGDPSFSYYLLSLSYAPDFCAQPAGDKDFRECGAGRHLGFVVHGLWPQGESSRGPEHCGPARPVSQEIVRATLAYIPTKSLIQHEWDAHGTCAGLSPAEYFALVRRARDLVKIPDELNASSRELHLSPSEIEAKLAAANPSFPRGAFRVSCYRDGELQEVRIAFSKDISPRPAGSNAGSCPAPAIRMRPVR